MYQNVFKNKITVSMLQIYYKTQLKKIIGENIWKSFFCFVFVLLLCFVPTINLIIVSVSTVKNCVINNIVSKAPHIITELLLLCPDIQ